MPLFGESNLRQGFSNAGVSGWHSQFSGNIPNSCSFDKDDSQYLERTTSSHSNNEVTLACWFQNIDEADGRMGGGNTGIISIGDGSGTGSPNNGIFLASGVVYLYVNGQGATTNKVLGDQGWYHIIASFKLDEASGPRKGRLFINGIEYHDWNADPRASGWGTTFNNVTKQFVGLLANTSSPDGYIAQPVFLDGQSIQGGDWTVDSFLDTYAVTPNRSVRTPKSNDDIKTLVDAAPSDNSAFLTFTNADAMGNDGSNHGNNFSLNNISSADQSSHTPSQVYVHWNGRTNTFTGDNVLSSPAQGRIDDHGTTLNADTQSVSADVTGVGDLFIDTTDNSGKYYLEYQFGGGSFSGSYYVGFIGDRNADHLGDGGQQVGYQGPEATDKIVFKATLGTSAGQMEYYIDADSAVNLTLASGGSFPRIVSASDRLGILYDFDNNQVVMYDKDGNASTPVSWTPDSPSISIHARGNGINGTIFTDSADWTHSVADVKEWKSENISAPTYNGVDYFDAITYEGNGTGQRVGDFVPYTDLYTVNNSIIFDPGTKNHLQRTMSAAASDSNKKFTLSAWAKRVSISDTYAFSLLESSNSNGSNLTGIRLYSTSSGTGNFYFQLIAQGAGVTGSNVNVATVGSAVQTSSWQHFFIQVDTTQSTASDRVKLYIDGVLQEVDNASGSAAAYPDQDAVFYLGDNDEETQIGKIPYGAYYSSMYIAEHAFLTGTNSTGKTISDFGAVDTATNKWVPKDISGFTFGHNGHYLEFKVTPGSSNGAGTDTSGNGNHFAEAINDSASAWSSYTYYQTVDAPTKNYATLSQITGLTPTGSSSGVADISDGNLRFNVTGGSNSNSPSHTPSEAFAIQEGKWYFEVEAVTLGQAWNIIGLTDVDDYQQQTLSGSGFIDDAEPGQWGYLINAASTTPDAIIEDGNFLYDTSGANESPYNGISNHKVDTGDVLGVHIERTGNTYKMWFSRNGTHYLRNTTQQPIIEFGTRGRVIPFVRTTNGSGNREFHFNFGQQLVFDGSSTTFNTASDGYWKNAPASGYKALNQDNLDATASKLTAFAWIKNRDATDAHILVDRLRGVGKTINSNDESIEASEPDTVQRFLQRGVQIGNDVQVNTDRESYVMWQWLSGETAGTGSVTSPAGALTSNTIVSTPGNFSVGTYRGTGSATTVGHGLGGAPELIFVKNRSSGSTGDSDWVVGTQYAIFEHDGSDPWTDYGHLDTTGNFADVATKWNDTAPNANTFTIGTHDRVNKSNDDYVFYAFRSVPGVCKIGNYLGNHAGQPGPAAYINCGFTPRMVMVKNLTTSGDGWMVFDTARHPFNVTSALVWEDTTTEFSNLGTVDILANGFKIQAATSPSSATHVLNESNQPFLYFAMADIGGNGDLPPLYGR